MRISIKASPTRAVPAQFTKGGYRWPSAIWRVARWCEPSESDPDATAELVGYSPVHLRNQARRPKSRTAWSPWSACRATLPLPRSTRTRAGPSPSWRGTVADRSVRLVLWSLVHSTAEGNHPRHPAASSGAPGQSHARSASATSWAIWPAQVNSVVDRFSEVITQIREMTASVSTASNELNTSAGQLAQGSHEQAATLQEIAGSLQSVDASVGRNAAARQGHGQDGQ